MMKQEDKVVNGNASKHKQLTISELAKRHLTDPNHTTTDEEMRNAKLELTGHVEMDEESLHTVDNTTVFPAMDFEKEGEKEKVSEEEKDDSFSSKTTPPNPYDVLG